MQMNQAATTAVAGKKILTSLNSMSYLFAPEAQVPGEWQGYSHYSIPILNWRKEGGLNEIFYLS